MKVINLEEDRLENVSDGYARNYLMPKGLAIPATPAAVKQMEKRAEANRKVREEKMRQARELSEKLSSADLVIKADAGEEGKLFGTVTNSDVAKAVKDTFGVELDKRKVNLNDHIKAVGTYTASVKIHTDVVAHIKAPRREKMNFPDQPGVYLFKDKAGKVIYVGKAKSLK